MPMESVIVEIKRGTVQNVLAVLADIKQVGIFGTTDNRIVIVVEGDDKDAVERTLREVKMIENVTGIYSPLTDQ